MTLIEREANVFFHTYKRIPLEIDHAEGVYVYDKAGKKYLDFFAGLAVNALGHRHPKVVEAIEKQLHRYMHLSNYYLQDVQIELGEMLVRASGLKRVFLTNTGAEANEGAMKLARKWGAAKNKKTIHGFTNSFHGRTFAALSVMANEKYAGGIAPLVGGMDVLPYNDVDALNKNINETTCAVIFEAIQGEGGIVSATKEFVDTLAALRKKYDFLIISDEIQCGLGRTGRCFGYELFGLKPDIVTVAKSLGGGLPLAAILGTDSVADIWQPGDHGTTFGGNPVACAAGMVVLQEIQNGLMDNAAKMGAYLNKRLVEIQKEFPALVAEVRGVGLMAALRLTREGDSYVTAMRDRGVLINCTNKDVLRFLPPLIINEKHCDEMVENLKFVLKEEGKDG
jgi:acetylornithine/N-succinyldiaminopimelate aminotransferase